ncbi:uncharacterized protein BXZ73DRAFT_99128 [Epithele typhae]|uniref:uncharacterized protein n=1 Tax=Epithele typhae TaxID=378194 RepID=UPI002008E55F|nr:uncharacterized protein BXZ73DRAFT_99128 [Epithele typhae]KAH9940130.1 hypothetical protein BXZ73DRAFT_99128 [Epithele typhae]
MADPGSTLNVPYDIVVIVVHALAKDLSGFEPTVYAALRTLCLVNREWCALARPHLYSYVWLAKLRNHILFCRTVTAAPHLGALVRDLKSYIFLRGSDGWRAGTTALGGPFAPPMTRAAAEALTNLRALAFASDAAVVTVPQPLLAAMAHCARCARLRALSLSGFSFMSFALLRDFVQGFRGVATLRVRRCDWLPNRIAPPVPAHAPVESVRSVDIHAMATTANSLLNLTGPAVTELKLWCRGMSGGPDTCSAIRRYSALRSIELTYDGAEVHWMIDALGNVSSPAVSQVVINHVLRRLTPSSGSVAREYTERLDHLLCEPRFLGLQRVVVRVYLPVLHDGEVWMKLVVDAFPQCQARGILISSVHEGDPDETRNV